jgi:sugar/nucleoside kinase (ribokinase family)
MAGKIIVSGTGCCLVDILYNNIDFGGETILPFLSRVPGDGGLVPGKLVFEEEFERYCGVSLDKFTEAVMGGRPCNKLNIGGPSIVSLINAAQMTSRENCEVRFYGSGGNDKNGRFLLDSLKKTPVVLRDYRFTENRTPSTLVLSDPDYDDGHGERMFINSIGSAWDFQPDELDEEFFSSDIVVFGGTALVPQIHDNLSALIRNAKSHGCVTIVNTVFDFRNEKADPSGRWPLGEDDESYRLTDLLIADNVEALRLSGTNSIDVAVEFFIEKGVHSFLITNGSSDLTAYSDGSFFRGFPVTKLPVSQVIKDKVRNSEGGDTTGCGDNFAGGVIASVVNQKKFGASHPDLPEACSWGVVSGGFTCFYMGGTYIEGQPGEKLSLVKPYYDSYREQLLSEVNLPGING